MTGCISGVAVDIFMIHLVLSLVFNPVSLLNKAIGWSITATHYTRSRQKTGSELSCLSVFLSEMTSQKELLLPFKSLLFLKHSHYFLVRIFEFLLCVCSALSNPQQHDHSHQAKCWCCWTFRPAKGDFSSPLLLCACSLRDCCKVTNTNQATTHCCYKLIQEVWTLQFNDSMKSVVFPEIEHFFNQFQY